MRMRSSSNILIVIKMAAVSKSESESVLYFTEKDDGCRVLPQGKVPVAITQDIQVL